MLTKEKWDYYIVTSGTRSISSLRRHVFEEWLFACGWYVSLIQHLGSHMSLLWHSRRWTFWTVISDIFTEKTTSMGTEHLMINSVLSREETISSRCNLQEPRQPRLHMDLLLQNSSPFIPYELNIKVDLYSQQTSAVFTFGLKEEMDRIFEAILKILRVFHTNKNMHFIFFKSP